MKAYPNSPPTQALSAKPEDIPGSVRAILLEFVQWMTTCLALFGIAAICRLLWQNDEALAAVITLFICVVWILLTSKLGIFSKSTASGTGARYTAAKFLADFVGFSFWMALADVWLHNFRGHIAESAMVGGLVFALSGLVFRQRQNHVSPDKVS